MKRTKFKYPSSIPGSPGVGRDDCISVPSHKCLDSFGSILPLDEYSQLVNAKHNTILTPFFTIWVIARSVSGSISYLPFVRSTKFQFNAPGPAYPTRTHFTPNSKCTPHNIWCISLSDVIPKSHEETSTLAPRENNATLSPDSEMTSISAMDIL